MTPQRVGWALLAISSILAGATTPALAAEDPPAIGAVLLEDPLTAPGALTAKTCPTGRSAAEFVGEGYLMKVRGPCIDGDRTALLTSLTHDLSFTDGEIRLEMKVANGGDRGMFHLWFRDQGNESDGYALQVRPTLGWARLGKWVNREWVYFSERPDLSAVLSPNDWNTIAIIAEGPGLWVVLNDELVIRAADESLRSGGLGLQLLRGSNLTSQNETAVVVRNLRVSVLSSPDTDSSPAGAIP